MKKLDKLILKSFLGPFIVTFFITLFILVMQNLWKYIDDLVGKGLDFATIGQFLWYATLTLLTLAMPIAILISSIMTFGNLGESFELVAIKSSGISLLRFMRPLMWVAVLLCGITFCFANYVIPFASLKFATLYNEIFYKKPAFDLKEGVFFTYIPGYSIKVGKKDSDGKTIRDVLIYEQGNPIQDNSIIAKKGVMQISPDQNFLEFNLEDGFRYQERGTSYDSTTEYIRLGFKTFKKLFDLSSLKGQKADDELFKGNQKMLSARQLSKSIDSLNKATNMAQKRLYGTLDAFLNFSRTKDSVWKLTPFPNKPVKIDSLFPDSARIALDERATSVATEFRNVIQFNEADQKETWKKLNFNKLEWHRKFSFSMACLVLFFIGAPLGSIIRKGGLGMPLVVAIIFFLIFHLLNMFGEKFVREGIMSPFTGMWMAVMVLIPIGIFLTYKAMNDSQLFNKEFYNRSFKKLKPYLAKLSRKKSSPKA